ncbi:hypothetical protein M011DRAFT_397797 [Sporormia fimetaria CBS 119925]|uniref:Uncharacterized protein n=1 Tax=Sporormia fimetaria CBS 119925 TaxID=1340428 RepID=A0A6A6VIQ9_9PLEO|nr:hypothetical protein M011DRAFT_397797 [Sporormia fimetaria CBS 119925]
MLRSTASRVALRSFAKPTMRPAAAAFQRALPSLPSPQCSTYTSSTRPQLSTPLQESALQRAIRRNMAHKIELQTGKVDTEAEKKYAKEKLKPHPETFSANSTMHPVFGEEVGGDPKTVAEPDMMAGVKNDLTTIKETFDLSAVPREAYWIGMAGVLPYLATSISTVACAYEINHSVAGYGYVLSAHTAESLLHILEPLQIGYGAQILSFLGAIHWGLEFARFGGAHGYKRYAIGVLAPAVAWPTVLLPVETALVAQFAGFMMLYFLDTNAQIRGWTPNWYSIYRFVLTFVVGFSIVLTLIGRGEVTGKVKRMPGAVDRLTALRQGEQETLQQQEETIRGEQAEAAEKAVKKNNK